MKKIFFSVLSFLLLASVSIAAEQKKTYKVDFDEYIVYSAVMNSRIEMPAAGGMFFVVAEETNKDSVAKDYGQSPDGKNDIDPSLIEDFNSKNAKEHRLEGDKFPPGAHVKIITEKELSEIFSGFSKDGWRVFRERYIGAGGILYFSRVGFNTEKTQALLEVRNQANWEMGVGYKVFLKKRDNVWEVIWYEMSYIS